MIRSTTSHSPMKRIGTGLAVATFWLAVWQLVYGLVAQEILLVSPVQAVMRLFSLMGEGRFWGAVASTCLRVLTGFILGMTVGVVLAAAGARFRVVYRLTQPLMVVMRVTPVASFIILALVWIATDRVPIFIGFLMVVPIAWGNLSAGIGEVDRELLEMARVFRLSRGSILRTIYFPAVLPYFASAFSAGLGFCWKSAIMAEVLSPPREAVGRQIHDAKIYLETIDLFAWTMAVVLLSIAIEKLALWLLRTLSEKLGGIAPAEGGGADAANRG